MRRLSMSHDGEARTVDVRIPPGVGDGSRVRVLVAAELAEYPNTTRLAAETVTVSGAQVNVTLREDVRKLKRTS